jgi:hypothetical protein
MRPIHWFTAIVVCLILFPTTGYTADSNITVVRVTPSLDLDQMQFIMSHERKDVFERGMPLASNQLDVFWNVFDEYAKDREKLDAKRLRLLGTFVSRNARLTNEEAIKLVKASGENQQADLALRQKYFKILSKKLNPVVAARFVQLDDLVGMVLRLAILGNVPLITGDAEAAGQPASSPDPASLPAPVPGTSEK